jgi:hypothetical protein
VVLPVLPTPIPTFRVTVGIAGTDNRIAEVGPHPNLVIAAVENIEEPIEDVESLFSESRSPELLTHFMLDGSNRAALGAEVLGP